MITNATAKTSHLEFIRIFFSESASRQEIESFLLENRELSRFSSLLVGRFKFDNAKTYLLHAAILKRFDDHVNFIKKLSKFLAEQNISIVLLKSTALNGDLYDKSHPRGNSDIDFFIKEEYRETYRNALLKVAYPFKDNKKNNPYSDLYEETWICRYDPTIIIDVHFALSNPILFNCDDTFTCGENDTSPHPLFNNNSILKFNNELNLANCFLHIFGDGYVNHHSLFDIISILKTNNIRFPLLEAKCQQLGCLKLSRYLLNHTNHLDLGIQIPENYRVFNKHKKKLLDVIMEKKLKKNSSRKRIQQICCQFLLTDSKTRVIKNQCNYFFLSFLSKFSFSKKRK